MVRRRFWACLSFLVAPGGAGLYAAVPWTPDDLILQERATALALAPDASCAVWVKSQIDKDKGEAVAQLMLTDMATGTVVQLTRGTDHNGGPVFSPDGKRIAFLSDRKPNDGTPAPPQPTVQVWMLSRAGGEPFPLTNLQGGVKHVAWRTNDELIAAAAEDPSAYTQAAKDRKDDSRVVDDEPHEPPVRLFRITIGPKTITRISENEDRIDALAVSHDGRWAVTVHEQSLHYIYDQKVRPATLLTDLTRQSATRLFADGKLLPHDMQWAADGSGFYFLAPFTHDPQFIHGSIEKLYFFDLVARTAREIALDWDRGVFAYAAGGGGFVAELSDGMRPRLGFYRRDSSGQFRRQWLTTASSLTTFASRLSDDGHTVLLEQSSSSSPNQWFTAPLQAGADGAVTLGTLRPVTALNPAFGRHRFAPSEVIHWKGAGGDEVEGLLHYPANWHAGQRAPLVTMIHGGPHSANFDRFEDSFFYPYNLICQRGAFVLEANYHGSSQYGLAWSESTSHGKYNDLEWEDVNRGIDAVVARGLADPARLGVMGWSNGAIITIELTTRTNRFKVASAGAGDVNWTSDWGNAVFGEAFDHYYLGRSVLEDPELYLRKSPLFRMAKVTTPTIIFFGTEDRQVPTEQGWQHFRALQYYGKAPAKFILLPGEEHGPKKYAHQARKLNEELAWFDKYLFQPEAEPNESLRPQSALAAAIAASNAGLEPSTVNYRGLQLGRFEVTRAQFHAFQPGYRVAPGTDNYPANGIRFDAARQYCRWLSGKTGKHYRLGTEEEMRELLTSAPGDNTLDAWAGYAVNLDDARRLQPLVDRLGAGALLKPVGSGSGAGEGTEVVFDLGGNVAEWIVTGDGSGKVLGGSADRPLDRKAGGTARSDYTGFRVVLDQDVAGTPRTTASN